MNNSSSYTADLPFISHLIELRNRLIHIVIFIACIALPLSIYANDIYALLAQPLMAHLPQNSSMIATNVTSPFMTPFKLSLVTSIFISMPFVLYQFWGFLAPALYRNEQRTIFPLLVASTVLFYCGVAFAYFVVAPLVLAFFTAAAPIGVTVMTDIEAYLDFVLTLFFAFGLCFEVPIFTIVAVWSGFTTIESLVDKRPYVIVGAFIIGMFLTPPDVLSQTLLAVPMWLLFEVGLLFARLKIKQSPDDPVSDSAKAISVTSQSTKKRRRKSKK
jgi:sec-independent protein translocase protein TatC